MRPKINLMQKTFPAQMSRPRDRLRTASASAGAFLVKTGRDDEINVRRIENSKIVKMAEGDLQTVPHMVITEKDPDFLAAGQRRSGKPRKMQHRIGRKRIVETPIVDFFTFRYRIVNNPLERRFRQRRSVGNGTTVTKAAFFAPTAPCGVFHLTRTPEIPLVPFTRPSS